MEVLGRQGGQIAWATELAERRVPEVLDHNSFLFNVPLPTQRLLTSPTIPTFTTIAKKLSTDIIIWLCFLNYAR